MFNPSDTHPYIGLRAFSEDDSLYFKGREEHIQQITSSLEMNKFLMLTGASGDGKSSLVYAGLVPNARAGFFKAKYTNWVVADFRPERSPLSNLCKTISRNLRIGNEEFTEVELRRGFSSLVDLYSTSSLYVNERSDVWINGNEEVKDELQRSASNLLIVADQFEEFFTNPENYYRNAPSADSQLVINLLLETARISIEKNLPIYIVCTMRSDYIGQCTAFRGLPEFIGFSQFFVPRLKRKEMIQVVKEPAYLHGDKISDRLVERVVYDLGEGIDQLPVLEHAMNEVWIQANNGKEQLDLVHYAMVGGMSKMDLPVEDQECFSTWFSTLAPKFQDAYQKPGLSRIIGTHANKLYLSAADHYNQDHENKINSVEAQLIIKVAFTCLTKMDEGRAVRNRMTLQEITNIISKPDLPYAIVGGVLNIFRESGNTFLRPYLTDNPETLQLQPNSVLDITHESLIRNWELLGSWTKEEFDNLTIYLDFKKQLDRWLESGLSKGFLLPIGPLTFFESWYEKLNPSKYWVNRYLNPDLEADARLAEANKIILDAQEFLRRSAAKVRVTRLIVKYGAIRIASIIAAIVIIGLCVFYYQDARQKENDHVIQTILDEGIELAPSKGIADVYLTKFLIISEFLKPGTFKKILNKFNNEEKASIIADMHLELVWVSTEATPSIRKESLYYLDSIIQTSPARSTDAILLNSRLKVLNLLVTPTVFYLYSHADERLNKILSRSLEDMRKTTVALLSKDFDFKTLDAASINTSLEYALHYQLLTPEDIRLILSNISIFEGPQGSKHFSALFPTGKYLVYNGGAEFNQMGGYQQLANLYASLGDVEKVKICVDMLMKWHSNYPSFGTNIFNIANYFITYAQEQPLNDLISYYCQKQKLTQSEFYERWLSRTGILSGEFLFYKMAGANHNPNLDLTSIKFIEKIFDRYYDALVRENNELNALHFKLALYYKHRGAVLSKIYKEQERGIKSVRMDSLFEKAVEHFHTVSLSYLEQPIEITVRQFAYDQIQQKIRRKDLFLYPDHFPKIFNNRGVATKYFGDQFFNFLLNKKYFSTLYKTSRDLNLINDWIVHYYENRSTAQGELFHYLVPLSEPVLVRIDSLLSDNPQASKLNNNLIRLLLINFYIENEKLDNIEKYYQKLQPEKFKENLKVIQGIPNDFYFLVNRMAGYLATRGRIDEVIRITQSVPGIANHIKTYSLAAKQLMAQKAGHQELAFILLDSALSELNRIKDFEFTAYDPRIALVQALSSVGGEEMYALSRRVVETVSIAKQKQMIEFWIGGTASSGNYFKAYSSIPAMSAPADKINYYTIILWQEAVKHPMDAEWKRSLEKRMENYMWENISIYEVELF